MVQKNHLKKYVKYYAETIALTASDALIHSKSDYHHCIVVPAYNESHEFIEQFTHHYLQCKGCILLIVVINQPDNMLEHDENQQLWNSITHMGDTIAYSDNLQLINTHKNVHILSINCFTNEKRLPPKQGVGLARKIGCDIACILVDKKKLKTSWIHTTDADSQLPQDYLMQAPTNKQSSAAIYSYRHQGSLNAEITQATQLYERALHYYVDGLSYANSPYAYHALGSCIAISVTHYAQARGFPKKAGGEDFYLLNKLAKLGRVITLTGKPVTIKARVSNRVPFGTGPAVDKIMQLKQQQKPYVYYNHKSFVELHQLLLNFYTLSTYRHSLPKWLMAQSQASQTALAEISIQTLFKHLSSQQVKEEHWTSCIHQWFDAFKTLKFIHSLEKTYPKQILDGEIKQLAKLRAR